MGGTMEAVRAGLSVVSRLADRISRTTTEEVEALDKLPVTNRSGLITRRRKEKGTTDTVVVPSMPEGLIPCGVYMMSSTVQLLFSLQVRHPRALGRSR